jgi:SAM-dependent methyltransferase
MSPLLSSNLWNILTCSYCGHELVRTNSGAGCSNCNLEYEYSDSGSLDLRLRKPKKIGLEFELGIPLLSGNGFQVEPLIKNSKPEVDFTNTNVPRHLTKEILSYFPRAKSSDNFMLDLGCGDTIHKGVCEQAGFEWVGLDYKSATAPILGDAHSLPFKSETFDFILSIAVLEHIRYPFVMMREAYRVLKPHGKFIGTVAFLEPFHEDSFYHHTHLGTINSLQYGGFIIEKLAPSEEWSVLVAQASMALFPKMPSIMSRSIVYPIQQLHKLWWQAGSLVTPNATKHIRVRNTTGAFTFVATKGAA